MSSLAAIRAQLRPIPVPTTSFAGQTVIVTGSNTGLGLEAARHFVRLDAARVILAVRSVKKGESAQASIEASTNRKDVVEVWQVDMSDYDSIRNFTIRCGSLDRLDVVIANAGVLRNTYEESGGTEITIKVNVIGTFLLVLNLLPILRKSRERTGQTARLVITSSVVHENACLPFSERNEPRIFEAFNKDKKSYINDRYNTSKLLEVLLVRSLAAAMQKGSHSAEPVILNAVNPGLCHSELDKEVKGIAGPVLKVAKALLARTTEVGGRTLVHSAAAGEESYGQYMSECEVKEPSAFVRSNEGLKAQQRVHDELLGILETIQPGIYDNI
ncbi:Retinol dehydrogenase 12 [Pleurostoma richardsiae]|uniref:Retinol dehydrogenase 12 n=1 Tax=Pleurostoma richardsiae TaxID=41990 RepID=A0AA38RJT7_9PEZI|nr:Retinol dehydrogenase 12 [Pleurostoma richardsiae]